MKKIFLASSLILAIFFVSCGTKQQSTLRHPGTSTGNTNVDRTGNTNNTSKNKGGTSVTGIAYIDRYKEIAIDEMNRFGIPASIKLAQALLESGNGNSYLATNANNHFGIKCGGVWNGKSVTRPDDSLNDCFRVYENPEQSFKDHSQFLLRKRYEKLFQLSKNDYKGWAKGLKEAGYATNPRYPELLIDLIERYNLQQYDRAEKPVELIARAEKVDQIIEHKAEVEPAASVEQIKKPIAMQIYEVKSSDTLTAIASKYKMAVGTLKDLNGLTSETIYAGQLLVVSK
ncbi:glucosaminidase domain-containing protein [Sphingobacterium sp. HJSM2_6]|uniref:glucosaminidase domain-containing protein n=1 Tax=Sphingobacterium sp. HJSM2_6 TaxID=3366264 RepID=UPI003BBF7C1A